MNELYHHGVLGMKWGVRRYQNKDGTLTPAGKRREARLDKEMKKQVRKYYEIKRKKLSSDSEENRPKTIREMSDDEIQARINRIKKEQELASLMPKHISKGRRFYESMRDEVIAPAAKEAGKRVLTNFMDKKASDFLGLNSSDEFSVLKREVETLELRKRKKDASDYLEGKKDNSDDLAKRAKDYDNRQKIDKGEQYFKEGKYAKDEDKKKKK